MTVFDAFVKKLDNEYGKIRQSDIAKTMFKNSVDVGTAIVSILSNTGIAGFKFNIPQKEQVQMQSDVTDHYVDTNNPVQDHIARKPVTITLQGLQGEYFYSVNQIEDTLAKVIPTISLVKQFLPKLQPEVMRLKTFKRNYNNEIVKVGAAHINAKVLTPISFREKFNVAWDALDGVDLFKLFQEMYKIKSSQTRAFMFFEALWRQKAPFTVETTWKRYENMVITNVQPLRDNNADITDFTLSFKQINVTASLYRSYNNAAGRTRQQLAEIVKKGVDKGKKVSTI